MPVLAAAGPVQPGQNRDIPPVAGSLEFDDSDVFRPAREGRRARDTHGRPQRGHFLQAFEAQKGLGDGAREVGPIQDELLQAVEFGELARDTPAQRIPVDVEFPEPGELPEFRWDGAGQPVDPEAQNLEVRQSAEFGRDPAAQAVADQVQLRESPESAQFGGHRTDEVVGLEVQFRDASFIVHADAMPVREREVRQPTLVVDPARSARDIVERGEDESVGIRAGQHLHARISRGRAGRCADRRHPDADADDESGSVHGRDRFVGRTPDQPEVGDRMTVGIRRLHPQAE